MSGTEQITSQVSILADNRTDSNLLRKVRDGDPHAFEKLYYRYYRSVFGFVFKATRSKIETEDIVQDVFARLWGMRAGIEPDKNFKALLFTMVRRAAIDLYRRTGRTHAIFAEEYPKTDISLDFSPEDILEHRETKLLLQLAIENMPRKQRQIFSLHYDDNLSPTEIAGRLGLSYDNVRKQIYNGKRKLRESISPAFPITVAVAAGSIISLL
jgi:RNA polymerase sigma-70 factor (ECF subfamily)